MRLKNLSSSVIVSIALMGLAGMVSCQSSENAQESGDILSKADTFETSMDSVSYVLGTNVYQNFQRGNMGVNDTMVLKGLSDAIQGNDTILTDQEKKAVIQQFQKKMQKEKDNQRGGKQGRQEKRRQRMNEKAKANMEKSQSFLDDNKKQDGVKVTNSGLQYKVLEKGKGDSPAESDTVRVHYKGELRDGSEFDNSYKRGEPAEFPVGGVIPGWTEGLQLMQEGAKYKLFIPPELGYGKRGAGRKIGPNEVLIFEVELLEVN